MGMIILGLFRISALSRPDVVQDVPCEILLLQLEASIAVLMFSLSAFRSLFASEGSRAARRKPNIGWTAGSSLWKRKKRPFHSDSDLETNGLPSIPSATMTGLRSFIRGSLKPTVLRSESDEIFDDHLLTLTKPETLHVRNSPEEVQIRLILCDNTVLLTLVLIG